MIGLEKIRKLIKKPEVLSYPCIVYSEEIIKENIGMLEVFFKKLTGKNEVPKYFSCKANPNPTLVNFIHDQGFGVDVSSEREFALVTSLGIETKKITVSGPAKQDYFIERLILSGIKALHIDSFDEANCIKIFLETYNMDLETIFTVRVNVDENSNKLGIGIEQLSECLTKYPFISGIHFYLGREKFSKKRLDHELQKISTVIAPHRKLTFYIGLGLSISDLENNQITICELLANHDCCFEMGRVMLETAGVYLAKILSIKKQKDSLTAEIIIDGGIQHISTSLIDFKRKIPAKVNFFKKSSGEEVCGEDEANIYGSLCLSSDLLVIVDNFSIELKRGDIVYIYPCGAYNIYASPNNFIMQNQASEYFIQNGEIIKV